MRASILFFSSLIVLASCSKDSGIAEMELPSQDGHLNLLEAEVFEVDPSAPQNPVFDLTFELIRTENGRQVGSVSIYAFRMNENSEGNVRRYLLKPVPVSQFTESEDGSAPTFNYSITSGSLLEILQIDSYGLLERDEFIRFQWEVVMDDGTFLTQESSNNLSEEHPFYNFEYQMDLDIECTPIAESFVGTYGLINNTSPDYVCDFFPSCEDFTSKQVNIEVGDAPNERVFGVEYKGFDVEVKFSLACGQVIVPEQITGLSCDNNPIIFGMTDGTKNSVDFSDDSFFTFDFVSDTENNCHLFSENSFELTRVN